MTDCKTERARGFPDKAESGVLKLYNELSEVVPKFREIIGSDVKPINGYDFEVNASAAQPSEGKGELSMASLI